MRNSEIDSQNIRNVIITDKELVWKVSQTNQKHDKRLAKQIKNMTEIPDVTNKSKTWQKYLM